MANIARRLRLDADDFAGQNFNRPVCELTLREGSRLIDLLKAEFKEEGAAR